MKKGPHFENGMFSRISKLLKPVIGSRAYDVLFLSSALVDEIWVRSTVLECHNRGLKVCKVICGTISPEIEQIYQEIDIDVHSNISFKRAANIKTKIVITASSSVSRSILPTRAEWLIHMPHSLSSLHMIYPEDAFDGYDLIFSAGPHHCDEFREITKARGLKNFGTVPIGYGKLDVLRQELAAKKKPPIQVPHILFAPSWGSQNLLKLCGLELVSSLLGAGYVVTLRPHPIQFTEDADVIEKLRDLHFDNFYIENPIQDNNAIFNADILIGDYSGINFEFAALRKKPVISVDVPLKLVNEKWEEIKFAPIEISHRASIGKIVQPDVKKIMKLVRDFIEAQPETCELAIQDFLYAHDTSCSSKAANQISYLVRER